MVVEARRFLACHNALRGIAALAVFAYHLQLDPNYRMPLGPFTPLVDRGYLWVDFFFMLSGYILSLSYFDRLGSGRRSDVIGFLRARIARILPMHLAALALLAALVLAFRPTQAMLGGARFWSFLDAPDFDYLILQAALVHIWNTGAALSWNIPSWSISAEMHVYLLVPLIAVALAKWPRRVCLVASIAAVLIYGYILTTRTSLDVLDPLAVLRCLAGFLVGVSIEQARRRHGALSDLLATTMQAASLAGMMLALMVFRSDWLAIPFLALLLASTGDDRGVLAAPLSRSPAQMLGKISYSLYLLNFPIILLGDLAWRFRPASSVAMQGTWCLGMALALIATAFVTFHVVEAPFRTLLGPKRASRAGSRVSDTSMAVTDPAP